MRKEVDVFIHMKVWDMLWDKFCLPGRSAHRSLKKSPMKAVLILRHATKISTAQTSMRMKLFNILRFTLQPENITYN